MLHDEKTGLEILIKDVECQEQIFKLLRVSFQWTRLRRSIREKQSDGQAPQFSNERSPIAPTSWLCLNSKLIILFCSTSLLLTSTRWVRSTTKLFCTIHSLSSVAVDKSQQHWIFVFKWNNSIEKIWERRESNPGWLGGKRKRNSVQCRPPNSLYLMFIGECQQCYLH